MSGAVAQLVAHLHGMQGVRGSSPLSSTGTKGTIPTGSFLLLKGPVPGARPCVAPLLRQSKPRCTPQRRFVAAGPLYQDLVDAC